MAYIDDGLILIATGAAVGSGEGSAKSIYFYATADADTVVEANGYFDTTDLRQGDLVFASLGVGATEEVKVYTVSVGTGDRGNNDVTIAPMLIA